MVARVPCCKKCGFPIVPDEIDIVLTPLQKRIFHLVKRAGAAGIAGWDLMDMVYMHDINGGPESSNIIAVVCTQMNKRLLQFGLQVKGRRGPGGYFALQKVEKARVTHR